MSENEVYSALGAAVAQRRKALGLTQAEVAERIGLRRASVANIETGRQRVLLHQVYALANALDLEGIYLLVPNHVQAESNAPTLPMDEGQVTSLQRRQIERTIQQALTRGRPLQRGSS